MGASQLFVVPDLQGRPTGGTLYNRRLLHALEEVGAPVPACEFEQSERRLAGEAFGVVWLDSLYLAHAAKLRKMLGGGAKLGLLLHYLPSLVALGPGVTARELGRDELGALEVADCALVSSEFMAQVVRGLGFAPRPVLCVEPGCELGPRGQLPSAADGVRALVLAHIVNGKGVEPLLAALAAALEPSDRLELRIVGDTQAEPAYAARCQALVANEPALFSRVTFCGSLPESRAHEELFRSNLLLSASLMESYGMALSEGRRVGLPLLALDAGNVSAHVEAAAGGELVANAEELAKACVRLCRNPSEHARRLLSAQAQLRPARPWRAAALELTAALQGLLRRA